MGQVKAIAIVLCLFLANSCFCQSWIEWKQIAIKAYQQYDVGTASANLERAVATARTRISDSSAEYDSLIVQLSYWYTICMKFDKATPFLKNIIRKEYRNKQSSYEYIHALTNLGIACIYREETDSAYDLLKQAGSLINESFSSRNFLYAENMVAFSRFYLGMGKLDSALFCITEAGRIYSAGNKKYLPERILSLSMTGRIYQQIGDAQRAKDYLNMAYAEMKNSYFLVFHPYIMESMLNLWDFYALTGRYNEAQFGYASLLFVAKTKLGEDNALVINVYNNQGFLSLRTDKYPDAIKQLNQALNLLEKQDMKKSIYYSNSKNNLGLAYMLNKQFALADSMLSETEEMVRLKWGEKHYLYGMVLYNKGFLLGITGNMEEAVTSFITAGKIYRAQLISDITGLSEREKLSMYYMAELSFQILPSFAHKHKIFTNEIVENSIYSEQSFLKGLISFNQQKTLTQIRNNKDSILINRLDKWMYGRQQLSGAYNMHKPKSYTDSLLQETNLLERNLMSGSRSFRQYQSEFGISATGIAGSLKKNEAAIEFIRYRLFSDCWTDSVFYSALLIEPGSSSPVFIDLCTEQQLKKVLHSYYSNNDATNLLNTMYKDPLLRQPGKRYASDSLYNLVWKPMEKYLQNKSSVYISPTGLLNLISYPALPYNKKQLLTDKYAIFRLQHLSSLIASDSSANQTSNDIVLWGGINYDLDSSINKRNILAKKVTRNTTRCKSKWMPLVYTRQEVININNLFKKNGKKVTVFKDTRATRESFINAAITNSSFLHVATHGFYKKDTTNEVLYVPQSWSYNVVKSSEPLLRSGLVFAGANRTVCLDSSLRNNAGILTSYDIASMDLGHVKLATLSACETALGDIESGEGVFGLQRSLKLAGVDKMILTLWPVYDRQTSNFMINFYKSLLNGASIREAFITTQRKMRKTNTPQYWAGFILEE